MDVKEKIQQFLDYKGININQFEISIGVSKSYWRKTKSISANIVLEISRVYTDLNLEWLFRGTGEMLIGENKPQLTKTVKHYAEIEIDEDGNLKIKIKK